MSRTLQSVVPLLVLMGSGGFAQTVTLDLTSAGNNTLGGVYTSPYYATGTIVNPGASLPVICDDFTTESLLYTPWTAIATSFAQLEAGTNPAGTPKWCTLGGNVVECTTAGSTPDLQGYATAAVLAAELMTLPNLTGPNATIAGELSYALWDVFDPGLITASGGTNDPYNDGTLTSAIAQAAYQKLLDAQALALNVTDLSTITVNGHSIEGLTIYTPTGLPKGLDNSQEFLSVSMPEPSYPAVLALDLLAAVGLILFFRRRISGILN